MLGFGRGPRPDEESSPRRRWDNLNSWLDRLAIAGALFLVAIGALNLYAVEGRGTAVRQMAVVVPGLVLFVALLGGGGEDGTLQAVLVVVGFPYTVCGPLGSALAMYAGCWPPSLGTR